MIENLSNIFKLTLICALILGINPASAQNDDKLLIVKGYVIRYFASTEDFYPRASISNLTFQLKHVHAENGILKISNNLNQQKYK